MIVCDGVGLFTQVIVWWCIATDKFNFFVVVDGLSLLTRVTAFGGVVAVVVIIYGVV